MKVTVTKVWRAGTMLVPLKNRLAAIHILKPTLINKTQLKMRQQHDFKQVS